MVDQNTREKSVEELQKECDEYLAGWKRAKADLVNFQKQMERERVEWFMYANAACVKAILPVLDSLESAVENTLSESPPPRGGETQPISHPARGGARGGGSDGIAKIRDQMVEVLKSMGVEAIVVTKEPVNPELHEVVGVEKVEGVASGLMVREVQRGYTLHGKVLRPAKVIVAE